MSSRLPGADASPTRGVGAARRRVGWTPRPAVTPGGQAAAVRCRDSRHARCNRAYGPLPAASTAGGVVFVLTRAVLGTARRVGQAQDARTSSGADVPHGSDGAGAKIRVY
jgi:hypothetical protein